uniref:Uncharacterized protein n=1 Tax=Nelumbo nucifera TaxID=4432 RepID=A0A822YZ77_NELNU|nr:TPA_asm: hypothetical protein HUJ06_008468 [Nelumbo nucifera]
MLMLLTRRAQLSLGLAIIFDKIKDFVLIVVLLNSVM